MKRFIGCARTAWAFYILSIAWIAAACLSSAAQNVAGTLPSNPTIPPPATPYFVPAGKPAFDKTGAQVGGQLPDLPVQMADGGSRELFQLLAHDRPTLFLTSSFTCPRSRATYPAADELAARFKGKIDVIFIYIIEAHPQSNPSPYTGKEDVTSENRRDGILRRQPRTFDERVKLYGEFKDRLNVKQDVFIDGMDNRIWQAMGGGPNMGILMNANGIVLARQGWFDAEKMAQQITAYLEAAAANSKALQTRAHQHPDFGGLTASDIRQTFIEDRGSSAADLLTKFPRLVAWIEPFEERGEMGDRTLLQNAAQGSVKNARLLIEQGADVNFQTPHAPTPLHLAARQGDVEMIDLLLHHEADVNRGTDLGPGPTGELLTGPSPLQEALLNDKTAAARRLEEAGARPSFFTLAAHNDVEQMRRSLDDDPTLAIRPDGNSRPPLFYAISNNAIDAARLLIAHGAILRRPRDGVQFLPLSWAVGRNQIEMAKLLLDAGADVNEDAENFTPLCMAVSMKNMELVKLLLAHKANPNMPDATGLSPLHRAAEADNAFLIEALLDAGADVDFRTSGNRGPCGPPATDFDDYTALQSAVSIGNIDAMKLLLAHHASPAAEDIGGHAALQWAVKFEPREGQKDNRREMIDLLLAAGANLNAEDDTGDTALDLAEKKKEAAMVDYLQSRGGRVGSHHPRVKPKPANLSPKD